MRKSVRSERASAASRPLSLADTVKAWRAARGLSAAAAAQALEISVRTLEGIEQGRPFRYEKILRIALNRS